MLGRNTSTGRVCNFGLYANIQPPMSEKYFYDAHEMYGGKHLHINYHCV